MNPMDNVVARKVARNDGAYYKLYYRGTDRLVEELEDYIYLAPQHARKAYKTVLKVRAEQSAKKRVAR
jgi:hypothetical protein